MEIYAKKNGGLANGGRALEMQMIAAVKPIVDRCITQGVDLRHANHLAAQILNNLFTEAVLLSTSRRRKSEREKALSDGAQP